MSSQNNEVQKTKLKKKLSHQKCPILTYSDEYPHSTKLQIRSLPPTKMTTRSDSGSDSGSSVTTERSTRTGSPWCDNDLTLDLVNKSVKRQQQAIHVFIADMVPLRLSQDSTPLEF